MDIETRKTYDKIFETFNTEGWGLIQTRLVDMFKQQNNVLNIPDEKLFWQQRGSLGMLHLMIDLEQVIKTEVDQIEQQEEDDEND